MASALISSIATNKFSPERLLQAMRLTYVLLLPLNIVLIFYPKPLLRLINTKYTLASNPLRLYAIANIILLAMGLIVAHIYAKGDLNTTMSATRVALYMILTPLYGATRAAMAYLAGSITMTIPVLARASREGIKILSKHIIVATVVTMTVYLMLKPLGQSIATTILAITLAYAVLLALKILKKEELQIITNRLYSRKQV